MPTRDEAIASMAALGAETLAAAILDSLTEPALNDDWEAETIEIVLENLDGVRKAAGWPQVGNWDFDDATWYYEANGKRLGYEAPYSGEDED